jgi:predicted RNase H-like nuclease (RuvC/YqgF family)
MTAIKTADHEEELAAAYSRGYWEAIENVIQNGGVDAVLKNNNVTVSRVSVANGRLKKKVEKLKQQRDHFKQQLEHYKHVLEMSPFILDRHKRYEDIKKERERVSSMEKRVQEQETLIALLKRELEAQRAKGEDSIKIEYKRILDL